ncbi:LptF/LptG family permease [Luteolibacter algae]|uniref:LptF/LptG family permease n=1 Tax=Luteolibacter algae TaxID=454151 RepID=A0ABW5DBJ5_9BACT
MSKLPRWLLPLSFFLLGVVAAAILVPLEQASVKEQLTGFPDSHIFTNALRPYILLFLCFMPAIAAFAYSIGSTFDRYLSRQFLAIFGICLGALFSIWMLLDLNDNLSDFSGSKNMAASVFYFYLYRSPAILLVLLPYTLLLALIYCLGKFSKTNEIIAMIQSGTGIVRVSASLVFAGLWCSVLLLGLNYHWAPHAEGKRDEIIAEAKGLPIVQAMNVLYRDPDSHRLWMVGAFPANYQKGEALRNVEITTLNPDKTLRSRMTSSSASYNRETRQWTFAAPLIGRFIEGESPVYEQMTEPLIRKTWKETPSQIIKPGLSVEYLGIPELSTWLVSPLAKQATSNRPAYLTQWHYRWALPITCLVTVLLAAPLSIHFARRGAGSGIFLAVVLSMLMLFVSSITLALGESAILEPMIAAWLPNIVFTLLGLYLYHRRITGRPIYQSVKKLLTVNN